MFHSTLWHNVSIGCASIKCILSITATVNATSDILTEGSLEIPSKGDSLENTDTAKRDKIQGYNVVA